MVGMVMAAMLAASTPARAMPWAAPSAPASPEPTATQGEPAASPDTPAAPTTVEGALEAGDLAAAKALARQARLDAPSASTWQREGEVLEQAGDHLAAAKAYRSALAAARKAKPDDAEAAKASTAAEAGLVRVKAHSRGTVADEPASTHREALDLHWEPPKPQPVAPVEPPAELPPEPERIVTKWYFWVTVGAIAASAAAVTAIAIKAARDDQPDALDQLAPAPASQGFGRLRF